MKKLTYNKRTKTYRGLAFATFQNWLNTEIIIVAPNITVLKKFYKSMVGGMSELSCDPKLCRRVKVTKE